MSLIPTDPGRLPPYTLAEARQFRQRLPLASIENTVASCPSGADGEHREETGMVPHSRHNPPPLVREAQGNDIYFLSYGAPHDPCPVAGCHGTLLFLHR